jgi:KDO2-lipid IV(A) lauroyltransferase
MGILNILLYYGLLIPVSLLPFPVLYLLSDGLYVILYKVIGYRKKVVLKNISNSFPERSREEHVQIMSAFYRHFCDLVVESIKVFTISRQEVEQRFTVINPEFMDRFFDKGQSVIIAGGHYNNWELLAVAIDGPVKHKVLALYKAFKNQWLDGKMKSSRGKYGLEMISTKIAKSAFQREDLHAIIFGVDQSPSKSSNCYWGTFLNQDTPMIFGVEKYAKEYNYPVLYGCINKIKRGHYSWEFTEAIEEPIKTGYGEITQRIHSLLEQDIIAKPEFWLWSHKRWKHKRPAESTQQ